MTENTDYVELRSEDVQEILGTPPGWLVRWGATLVLLGFGMMVMAAWVLRYPDVVEAKLVLTTMNPPVDVVAQADGRIAYLYARDNDEVKENQVLAVLNSAANFRHMLHLDTLVNQWQNTPNQNLGLISPPENLELGDVQSPYADFIQALTLYAFGKSAGIENNTGNISAIRAQIAQIERSIDYDRRAITSIEERLPQAEQLYKNQKQLYEQNIISLSEFEKERTKLAELQRQKESYEENILRKRNEIIGLQRNINSSSFNTTENTAGAEARLKSSMKSLRSSIDQWKQRYLLLAPIPGRMSLNGAFYSTQQYVKRGEQVMTIVPPENGNIVGRIWLPVSKSGKVKNTQTVIIKLDSYPYNEYGALKGIVMSKSLVPRDDQYAILVAVPQKEGKLRTTFNRDIEFAQQLQGKAEIVTEDKGLLERIGEQLFSRAR